MHLEIDILIILLMLIMCEAAVETDNESVVEISALAGGATQLPCKVKPEVYGNNITVLTWHNDKSPNSIYSSQDHRRYTPTPSTASTDLRYAFVPASSRDGTAALLIRRVLPRDAALYRCHVDFESSRSHDTYVRLNVIERPSNIILMSNGSRVAGNTAGPYLEGDRVLLTCVAFGGSPLPNVTWWRGSEPAGASWSRIGVRRVRSDLHLHLARDLHGEQLSCTADNTDLAPPIRAHLTITMYLGPTQVLLYASSEPTRAGPFQLQCQVVGAHPTPTFVWIKGNRRIQPEQHVIEDPSGRGDLSTVTITVAADDNGVNVTCCTERRSADVDLMCSAPVTLHVYYTPVVQLTVSDAAVSATTTLLGSDVTLVCNATANPPIFNFVWYFNDAVIRASDDESESARAVLRLARVTRERAGAYRCGAANEEGVGLSQHVQLDVLYSPYCVTREPMELGLGDWESVNMTCNVSANPPPDTYRWVFVNATLEDPRRASAEGEVIDVTTDSVLRYYISDEFGYGTVLCWGQNDVSNASAPQPADACLFSVSDLGVPHQPTDCAAVRYQDGDISVKCEKGHDGGLPQRFTLTLLAEDGEELVSVSAVEPTLTAREPSGDYAVAVVAHNDRGSTEPVLISRSSVLDYVPQGVASRGAVADVRALLLALGGGVAALVLLACALALGARQPGADERAPSRLRRKRSASRNYATDESNCETCQESEGGSVSSLRRSDAFHRAVSGRCHARGVSFRSPRPRPRRAEPCGLHSLQNICSAVNTRHEEEALCDHLLLHLPVDLPNYSKPKPPLPFYTMPRQSHVRMNEQHLLAQDFDTLPLPPPQEEFNTFRSASDILNRECLVTKPSSASVSNNYTNVTKNDDSGASNNVIISPMNTVGLPSSSNARSKLYVHPEN